MNLRRAVILFACFFTIFMAYSNRYSYGILLPEMLPSLAITKAQAGVIYFAYFIAYTIFSPILGLMADRYDVRKVLTLFCAVMGIGTLLMATSSSLLQSSLFFTLAGVGCAACWAPVMALAQRWTPDKRRGMTLAFIDAGSSLGIIAAGIVIPLIAVSYDWRMGWTCLGILALVVAAVDYLVVRNSPASSSNKGIKPPSTAKAGVSYRSLFRNTGFWLIGLAYMLTGFAIIIPFTFLSTYAVQELAFSYEDATRLITLIGAGAIVGKLIFGPLSDKTGRIWIMLLCALIIAGGALAMAYVRGWGLPAIILVFGAGYGAVWSMYAACASDFFARESAGGIVGLWTFYLGIGSMISPIIAGWIADITGTLTWSFVMAAAGALISFFLLLPLLRRGYSGKS